MDIIGKLAAFSVLRATAFAALAICLSMFTLAFDPALALKVGGLGFLVLAGVMDFRAAFYPRKRRIRESEVWIMLDDDKRPPEELARRLIVPAMQRQLREKGLWVASVSAICLGLSFLTSLVGVA